jgi:hypothetical protein
MKTELSTRDLGMTSMHSYTLSNEESSEEEISGEEDSEEEGSDDEESGERSSDEEGIEGSDEDGP